jgi:extradiol dioxygenase family protein
MDVGFPSWIGVVCEDFENQRAFYGEVLGLREASEAKTGRNTTWVRRHVRVTA